MCGMSGHWEWVPLTASRGWIDRIVYRTQARGIDDFEWSLDSNVCLLLRGK